MPLIAMLQAFSTDRTLFFVTASLLGFVLFSAGAATAQDDMTEVQATQELTFEPDNITITAGETVRWVWQGGGAHTVTSTDSREDLQPNGEFDEPLTEDSGPVEWTFDEPGTYHYYCQPHASQGMVGTVTVEAADEGTPTEEETETERDTETEPFEEEDPTDTPEEEEDTPGLTFLVVLLGLCGVLGYLRRLRA